MISGQNFANFGPARKFSYRLVGATKPSNRLRIFLFFYHMLGHIFLVLAQRLLHHLYDLSILQEPFLWFNFV